MRPRSRWFETKTNVKERRPQIIGLETNSPAYLPNLMQISPKINFPSLTFANGSAIKAASNLIDAILQFMQLLFGQSPSDRNRFHFNQAHSQEFANGGGGLFRRLETASNDLDPHFVCPNSGDFQKKWSSLTSSRFSVQI